MTQGIKPYKSISIPIPGRIPNANKAPPLHDRRRNKADGIGKVSRSTSNEYTHTYERKERKKQKYLYDQMESYLVAVPTLKQLRSWL